jgi:CHAD domain-containing protein
VSDTTGATGVIYVPAGFDAQTQLDEVPWQLVRAALWQFHANLQLLSASDNPELVHQARIGWRHLRSTCRLLRKFPHLPKPPSTAPLRAMLVQLGALRECHVARYEVLPLLPSQSKAWHRFAKGLETDAQARLQVLRDELQEDRVGQTFGKQVVWLTQLKQYSRPSHAHAAKPASPARWAKHLVAKIHRQFERAQKQCKDAETQHQARIWAKRLRYAIEDFEGLLPPSATAWHKAATKAQAQFGAQRDLQITADLATRHGAHHIAQKIRTRLMGHSNRPCV